MTLLTSLPESEYPLEYLVARLQGRRVHIGLDWEAIILRPNPLLLVKDTPAAVDMDTHKGRGAGNYLNSEYYWVYSRMNNAIRRIFEPFFILHEMQNLLLGLRLRHARRTKEEVLFCLESSLLNNRIKKLLVEEDFFTEMLRKMTFNLRSLSSEFNGLVEQYSRQGYDVLEPFMWNAAFRGLQRIHTTLLMQQFFRYLIDMRNCLTLAKSLYWPLEAAPLFLDGGTLATALYEKAHRENDLSLIVSRLRIKAQADEVDTLHGLEKALQRTLSRTLKNWSRHGRTYASILYYLWEQYRYARNIGLVYFTSQMEPEAISEGLAG